MSWDVHLVDNEGGEILWRNYTGNCDSMIRIALSDAQAPLPDGVPWWQVLDGLSGDGGKRMLSAAIAALEAEPARFRVLNPPNGWGDYGSLLAVLREMRDAVPDRPCRWKASG